MEVKKKRKYKKKKIKKALLYIKFKKLFNNIKDKIKYILESYLIWMIIPFVLMDFFTFLFARDISYVNYRFISPILFSLNWITLFIGLSLSFKKYYGKIVYVFFNILFLVMFLVNNVYYSITNNFFDFSLIESASEGSPYMLDALKNCNKLVYIAIIAIIFFIILGVKKMPKIEKNNFKLAFRIIVIVIIIHLFIPLTLGKANTELNWASWRNPRNIYNSFNDNNKSIKITGLYEYSIRNFYITFLKTEEQENYEDTEFLDSIYLEENYHENKYTGIFKDKNLILVQLEGMDNWLVTEEDTPTLYNMMNNSYNFNNHYSYYNGGGSTFNSEFAVNTGYITPLSYNKNAYSFNKNEFPNSLAKIFKDMGYMVNAFHMNTGEYYSRTVNYLNWGYDHYYGLIDIDKYSDKSYQLDRELILNQKFNELLFDKDNKFVDYIITYSGHLPFSSSKGVCKMLNDMEVASSEVEVDYSDMTEEDCARKQATETDYMMQLLIENLDEKGLLDDTVIVVFTDHYLYTLEDQTILDKYKETSNNLINHTPFFIWTSDKKKNTIKEVTSQLNILPTILNLFGVKYNTNNYLEKDALDPDYEGIVFFSDYSWYDGNVYVENGEVKNDKKISLEKLEEKNHYIDTITKKNDLTLKYNYFKSK